MAADERGPSPSARKTLVGGSARRSIPRAAALVALATVLSLSTTRHRALAAAPPTSPAGAAVSRVYIATRDPNALVVVDTASGDLRATIGLPGHPTALAVAPDGEHAYVAVPDGIAVVDVAARQVSGTLKPGWQPKALALVPGGAQLVAVADDEGADPSDGGRLALLDLATGALHGTTQLRGLAGSVAVTADGRRAVVGHHFYTGSLTIVNLGKLQVEGEITLEDGVAAVVAKPDGQVLVLSGSNGSGRLTAIDPSGRSVVAEQALGDDPTDVALAPDRTSAWVADFRGGAVRSADAASLALLDRVPVANYPVRLAVAPDGGSVYVLHNGVPDVTRVAVSPPAVSGQLRLAGEPVAIAVPAAAAPLTTGDGDTGELLPLWAWLLLDGLVIVLVARQLLARRARRQREVG